MEMFIPILDNFSQVNAHMYVDLLYNMFVYLSIGYFTPVSVIILVKRTGSTILVLCSFIVRKDNLQSVRIVPIYFQFMFYYFRFQFGLITPVHFFFFFAKYITLKNSYDWLRIAMNSILINYIYPKLTNLTLSVFRHIYNFS